MGGNFCLENCALAEDHCLLLLLLHHRRLYYYCFVLPAVAAAAAALVHLLLPPVSVLRTVGDGGVVAGGDGIRPHFLPARRCCCSHRESVVPAEDGTAERLPTDVDSDGNVSDDAAVAAAAGCIGDAVAVAAAAGNVVLCSVAADGSVADDNAPAAAAAADDVGSAFR